MYLALETSLKVSMKWDGANKLSNTSYHQFHKVWWLFDQDFSKFWDKMPNFREKIKKFCRFLIFLWNFCDFSYWKSIYCVDLCAYTLMLCWWIFKMKELANNNKIFNQIDQFQESFSSKYGPGWHRNFFLFEKIAK